jgi:hypothetical protein
MVLDRFGSPGSFQDGHELAGPQRCSSRGSGPVTMLTSIRLPDSADHQLIAQALGGRVERFEAGWN